jgi:hypothetical protein
MRRTTQWAVFTSMNQQPRRSLFEPGARQIDNLEAEPDDQAVSQPQPETRSAPEPRRDRVDFM